MSRKQIAFTLIELLIVIAIIGILSGLIVVTMSGVTQKANIAKAQIFSNSLRNSLMSSMVGEWKFDELATASNGTAIRDSWRGLSTNLVTDNGTNEKLSSNCIYGKCISLDGTIDYVIASGFPMPGRMTWSVWIKPTYQKNEFVIDQRSSDVGIQPIYISANGSIQFFDSIKSSSLLSDPGAVKFDSTWQFIVVTGTENSRKIYHNGTLLIPDSIGISSYSSTPLYMGIRYSLDGVTQFQGDIDDVRVYDSALPTSQIKEQYYSGLNNLLVNGRISREDYLSLINDYASN